MGLMAREIAEIPQAAARLLAERAALARIGEALRQRDPALVVTIARGSSDHAAGFLKYLVEIAAGVPVASLGPSVASVYGRPLRVPGALSVAISQSGQSPDIVAAQAAAGAGGAQTLALTNVAGSPLAQASDHTLPLAAGPEQAVAATKSFVNSTIAGAALVAFWQQDRGLIAALDRLPDALDRALSCDWSAMTGALADTGSAYVLGRGPGYPIACEIALKLQETSGIHAQAYSAAEVLHGPAAIAESGFPVLALVLDDAARAAVTRTCERLAGQGAQVFATAPAEGAGTLPLPAPIHPFLDPIVAVAAFYIFAERLARAAGHDPDRPRHLQKVTQTR